MNRGIAIVVLLALACAGAGGSPITGRVRAQAPPGGNGHAAHGALVSAQQPAAVRIVDFGFSPSNLSVRAGTTVTWTNTGNAPHTVTAKNNAFDSKRLTGGQTFAFKFDAPGTFAYQCDIHPSMTGSVAVEAAAAAPSPSPTAAPAQATPTPAPSPTPVSSVAPAASAQAPNAARIVDFAFEPSPITVGAGSTVTWTHAGTAPHTVTAENKLFDSGRLTSGGTYSFKFDTPGTYAYKCDVHPARMSGTVIVQAAAGGEARGAVGSVGFGDGQARGDAARLEVQGLAPQPGVTLVGWLTGANGDAVRLGELKPDAAGKASLTYSDRDKRNLVALFERALVTAENGSGGARPAGKELMRDEVPAGAMVHIRHLLARFETTPSNTALATGLLTQAQVAAERAAQAKRAAQANDLAGMRVRLEQVINAIEGERGASFGDLNGDEKRDNPGDGFGLLNYAAASMEHAQLAIDAAPRDETVRIHGGHVMVTAKNASDWLTEARGLAVPAIRAPNVAAARPVIDRIDELLTAVLEGRDANRDGRIDPVAGEGGARTAYDHAYLMATLEPTAAQALAAPAPSVAPTTAPAAAAAAATPAPEATAELTAASDDDSGTRLVLLAIVGAVALLVVVGGAAWVVTGRRGG